MCACLTWPCAPDLYVSAPVNVNRVCVVSPSIFSITSTACPYTATSLAPTPLNTTTTTAHDVVLWRWDLFTWPSSSLSSLHLVPTTAISHFVGSCRFVGCLLGLNCCLPMSERSNWFSLLKYIRRCVGPATASFSVRLCCWRILLLPHKRTPCPERLILHCSENSRSFQKSYFSLFLFMLYCAVVCAGTHSLTAIYLSARPMTALLQAGWAFLSLGSSYLVLILLLLVGLGFAVTAAPAAAILATQYKWWGYARSRRLASVATIAIR